MRFNAAGAVGTRSGRTSTAVTVTTPCTVTATTDATCRRSDVHDGCNALSHATGGVLDFPFAEMSVAQHRPDGVMAKQPRDYRLRYAVLASPS